MNIMHIIKLNLIMILLIIPFSNSKTFDIFTINVNDLFDFNYSCSNGYFLKEIYKNGSDYYFFCDTLNVSNISGSNVSNGLSRIFFSENFLIDGYSGGYYENEESMVDLNLPNCDGLSYPKFLSVDYLYDNYRLKCVEALSDVGTGLVKSGFFKDVVSLNLTYMSRYNDTLLLSNNHIPIMSNGTLRNSGISLDGEFLNFSFSRVFNFINNRTGYDFMMFLRNLDSNFNTVLNFVSGGIIKGSIIAEPNTFIIQSNLYPVRLDAEAKPNILLKGNSTYFYNDVHINNLNVSNNLLIRNTNFTLLKYVLPSNVSNFDVILPNFNFTSLKIYGNIRVSNSADIHLRFNNVSLLNYSWIRHINRNFLVNNTNTDKIILVSGFSSGGNNYFELNLNYPFNRGIFGKWIFSGGISSQSSFPSFSEGYFLYNPNVANITFLNFNITSGSLFISGDTYLFIELYR